MKPYLKVRPLSTAHFISALIGFVFFGSNALFAQKQNTNWIFGLNAGVEKTINSINTRFVSFSSIEACATVSDPSTGALLFYSDGLLVWDKTGQIMLRGDSLRGSVTSAQGALILPHPTKPQQYLLFTTPAFSATDGGLYYSVIDMTLNGGMGAVVQAEKNILLYDKVCEGMTYTFNADSSGYWLLVHERFSNRFIALEINKEGIGNNMSYTSIGRNWGTPPSDIGGFLSSIKISPNGKRVAISSIGATTNIELYDFNNCTGTLSNELIIPNLALLSCGNAFSPNSQILYFSTLQNPSRLYQVNLDAGDSATILASIQQIAQAPLTQPSQNLPYYYGALQLHDDGKIYMAQMAHGFIHCIENPNNLGTACNFSSNRVALAPGSLSQYGLPQLVPPSLREPTPDSAQIALLLSDTCIEKNLIASFTGISNPDKVNWVLVNSTSNDTLRNDSLSFSLNGLPPGKYTLSLQVRKNCINATAIKSFTLYDCICEGTLVLEDSCFEEKSMFRIVSTDSYSSIQWLISDSLGNEIFSSNSKQLDFKFDSAMRIRVRAIVAFQCKTDTLLSSFELVSCPNCILFVPNAFSPNNDGLNDFFGVSADCPPESFELEIYTRWGERILRTSDSSFLWDGKYKDSPCPNGMYLYLIKSQNKDGKVEVQNGTFSLIR